MDSASPYTSPGWPDIESFDRFEIGSILQLKNLRPDCHLFDPSAEDKTASHPILLLKSAGDLAIVCTLTSTVCHQLVSRIMDGHAYPCHHDSSEQFSLNGKRLYLEGRRDVDHSRDSDDSTESEDEDMRKYLEWQQSSTFKAGYLNLYRMYVVKREECVSFKERGRVYRLSADSLKVVQAHLLNGVIGGLYLRCHDLVHCTATGTEFEESRYVHTYQQLKLPFKRRMNARNLIISVPGSDASFAAGSIQTARPYTPNSFARVYAPQPSAAAVSADWRQKGMQSPFAGMQQGQHMRSPNRPRSGTFDSPCFIGAQSGRWQTQEPRRRPTLGTMQWPGFRSPADLQTKQQRRWNHGTGAPSAIPPRPVTSQAWQTPTSNWAAKLNMARIDEVKPSMTNANAFCALQDASGDRDSDRSTSTHSSGSETSDAFGTDSSHFSLSSYSDIESLDGGKELSAKAKYLLQKAPRMLVENMRCAAHRNQKCCECLWACEPDSKMQMVVREFIKWRFESFEETAVIALT